MQHNTKSNILITIPWFTPAYKAGGPIQSVLNMVHHVKGGLQFEIVTGNTDIDGATLDVIANDAESEFNLNTRVIYLSAKNRLGKIKKILSHSGASIVFINGIYSFYYNLLPLLFFKGNRVIVSARGMLHPPALKQKWFKKKIYLTFLKPLFKMKKVEFHATDEMEARHIKNVMGDSYKIWVAPNIPQILPLQPTAKKAGTLHLITVALISPMKNHLKILQSLKLIEQKVVYDIVGPVFDADYWDECKKMMGTLPDNITVNYHGAAPPDKLVAFYQNAHVFICPSQSENFGHAFFEALSAGKPLITSHNTPWNHLQEGKKGINVEINEDEVAKAIRFFASMNEEEYTQWSSHAATFAREFEGVKTAEAAYLQMFQS